MKIEKNYISKLNDLVKVVGIIFLLGACQNDDQYNALREGPVLVKLSVSTSDAGNASGSSADTDSQISSIYILQFNANNESYGTLRYVAEGHRNASGTYTANLLQSMGANDNYKLVILANLPDYGFLYGLYGNSYEEVQRACLSAATPDPLVFDATHPYPMFGVINGGTSVQVKDGTVYDSSTELIRAVARVDIGIGTKNTDPDGTIISWTKGQVPFTMTEVQVWRAGQRYTYIPAVENYHWNTVTSGGVSSNKIVIDRPSESGGATTTKTYSGTSYITNGTYCLGQIYLPEADLQWENVYDARHANRLAIIVGGYYNNSSQLSYYRVDFTNDNSGVKMDILRNHIYQFSVTKVTDEGYPTAELAYKSVPKDISFTANLVAWTSSVPVPIPSIIGYRISYGRLNGENLLWDTTAKLNIPQKKKTWGDNKYLKFDYNEFYGEANSFYAVKMPVGIQNGQLYATAQAAFNLEGAYPNLMVSGDDIIDVQGNEKIAWKTSNTLTAFDICRNYQGEGYNDWRLPRLSELALIYLNRQSLESMRGFAPFSGTYWSGSEYLVSNSDSDRKHSEQAWGMNFEIGNPGNAANHTKTELLKIRCVRQVQ